MLKNTLYLIMLLHFLFIKSAFSQYPNPSIIYATEGDAVGRAGDRLVFIEMTNFQKLFSADTNLQLQLLRTFSTPFISITDFAYTSSHFYFYMYDGNVGTLYKTDGLTLDSIYHRPVSGTSIGLGQGKMLVINDELYFFANDTIYQESTSGMVLPKIPVPYFNTMMAFNNNIIYSYVSNGIDYNSRVYNLSINAVKNTFDGLIEDYLVNNQKAYFKLFTINGVSFLGQYDEVGNYFSLVDTTHIIYSIMGELNGKIIGYAKPISSSTGVNNWELYGFNTSPGSLQIVSLIKDIYPGPTGSLNLSGNGIRTHSKIIFAANDSVHGLEYWVTNGTTAGTHMIYDFTPGTAGSEFIDDFGGNNPEEWAYVKGDTMIGTVRRGVFPYYTQMCVTDGNVFYTIDLHPNPNASFERPEHFTPWNHAIYYHLEMDPSPWGNICRFNPDSAANTVGLINLNNPQDIRVFPNPVSTTCKISGKATENSLLRLFDQNGRIVFESYLSGPVDLDLSTFTSGYYLGKFEQGGRTICTLPILKQ